MKHEPLVSVIVVNYNGRKYLKRCLESIYSGSYKSIEVIFVDNGSDDFSAGFVKENFPQVAVMENKENLGLSIPSNRAASVAGGEYLLFYNNDTVMDREMIKNLVKKCQGDENIGICGCKTLTYDGKKEINSGVSCDIFGYPFKGEKIFYVDAAIFIKKDVFDEIGGFDEQMFLYGEDRDICWRAWLYGYKVAVEKDAFFLHDSFCVTQNIKDYRTSPGKRYLGEFNALRSVCKNYSLGFLLWVFPVFLAINLAEVILFLFLLRPDIVKKAYIKAYVENIRNRENLSALRRKAQRERRVSDRELIRHMYVSSGKLTLLAQWGLPKIKN